MIHSTVARHGVDLQKIWRAAAPKPHVDSYLFFGAWLNWVINTPKFGKTG
jgi:hypothetical protein